MDLSSVVLTFLPHGIIVFANPKEAANNTLLGVGTGGRVESNVVLRRKRSSALFLV